MGGREYSGEEAEKVGMINQAFPGDELEARVLGIARRITEVPPDVVTVNKRFVYTSMEYRGARAIVRTAADLQAGPHLQQLSLSAEELSGKVKASTRTGE